MRIIAGWKTKFGNLMIAIGGGLCIASVWYPQIPDKVITGIVILGAAIAFYGAYNRFCRAFYQIDERGNPDTNRSKLKKARLKDGEIG